MANTLITNNPNLIYKNDLRGLSNRPIGTNAPLGIFKRTPNTPSGLTPDNSFAGRGTFSVLPSPPPIAPVNPQPAPNAASAQGPLFNQQQIDHRDRIIQFGIKNNRPLSEIQSVLKTYGYDKLKAPTIKTPKTIKDAQGFQRFVLTGKRAFPSVTKKSGRSVDKILKDIRITQSSIAARQNNNNFTDALLRTTFKDNPAQLAALGLKKGDSTVGLNRTLDLLKQEFKNTTGKSFSGQDNSTATPNTKPTQVSVSNGIATIDGHDYVIAPDGTILYSDKKRHKIIQ